LDQIPSLIGNRLSSAIAKGDEAHEVSAITPIGGADGRREQATAYMSCRNPSG
jgi:hypothetical protein